MPSILFSGKIYHPFGITQVLYRLTLNSHKSLLSRYTDGYISDNNKHRICSKQNIDKNITLFNSQLHLTGIFCALVNSSQPAMTMLSEHSGSLAQHLTLMNFSFYAGDMHGLPIMFFYEYIQ